MESHFKRTWAEVDLDAIELNFEAVKRQIEKGCRVMPVIKADAYGHGAVEVANALIKSGADYFAVSCLDEAMQLRENGIKTQILILGDTPAEFALLLSQNEITQTICDLNSAILISNELKKHNKRLKVHIKIDTGMSRLGILADNTEQALEQILKIFSLENIDIEGIFTHFADADNKDDQSYTKLQLKRFQSLIKKLEDNQINIKIKHAANSAAILNYKESHFDMVRPGILLYGMLPDQTDSKKYGFIPAMQLKTKIAQVKKIKNGTPISYGLTELAQKDTKIAVIPIGYADGFSRLLSSKARLILQNSFVRLVGRVCMDMSILDVSEIEDVNQYDTVTIIGGNDLKITAEDIAKQCGSINYEICCMIGKRVPRCYFSKGEEVAYSNAIRK